MDQGERLPTLCIGFRLLRGQSAYRSDAGRAEGYVADGGPA